MQRLANGTFASLSYSHRSTSSRRVLLAFTTARNCGAASAPILSGWIFTASFLYTLSTCLAGDALSSISRLWRSSRLRPRVSYLSRHEYSSSSSSPDSNSARACMSCASMSTSSPRSIRMSPFGSMAEKEVLPWSIFVSLLRAWWLRNHPILWLRAAISRGFRGIVLTTVGLAATPLSLHGRTSSLTTPAGGLEGGEGGGTPSAFGT